MEQFREVRKQIKEYSREFVKQYVPLSSVTMPQQVPDDDEHNNGPETPAS
jgi:hypothetical protein